MMEDMPAVMMPASPNADIDGSRIGEVAFEIDLKRRRINQGSDLRGEDDTGDLVFLCWWSKYFSFHRGPFMGSVDGVR